MNPPIVRIPVESVEKLIASIDRLSELVQRIDDHRRSNETVDMIMDGLISELQADVAKRAAEPIPFVAFDAGSKRHAELQEAVTRIEQNRRKQDQWRQMREGTEAAGRCNKIAEGFCQKLAREEQLFGGLWE